MGLDAKDGNLFVSGWKENLIVITVDFLNVVNEFGIRVFSRYFAFEKYKTDGTTQLEKNYNFEELIWTKKRIRHRRRIRR